MSELTITAIEQQKKDKTRYSVFINGKFDFGLSGVDLLYYKLDTGISLSPEKYTLIINDLVLKNAKECAVRYIGYRARSVKEVKNRLTNDYSEEIIEAVVDFLLQYNYINDRDFARLYIKDKMTLNGLGYRRIKYELILKGVSEHDIEAAYNELNLEQNIDDAKNDMIVRLIEKKSHVYDVNNPKERKKLMDFLIRKGYDFAEIKTAIEGLDISMKHKSESAYEEYDEECSEECGECYE